MYKTDFNYPLHYSFNIYGYESSTLDYVLMYSRNISVQQGDLKDGLNLHLNKLT
jgi:hypothetical protein